MRSQVRISLVASIVGALIAVSAPAAAQAAFGVESFFAANCKAATTCTAASTEADPAEFFSQASGHPPQGVTDFKLKTIQIEPGVFVPDGLLKNVRTDVAPGVSTNPQAVAQCSVANFTSTEVEQAKHFFLAPKCATAEPGSTVIGENTVVTALEVPEKSKHFIDVPLTGKLYNLEQPNGLSSYFGVALEIPAAFTVGTPLEGVPVYVHTFLEGHIEWASDYHDYYEIKNISPGLISSRIIFDGTAGNTGLGGFVTNPSNCAGAGAPTTTRLGLESYEGATASASHVGVVPTEGCNGAAPFAPVPFAPTFSLTPETTQQDQPDGITAELAIPHDPSPAGIDSSQLKTATVTLPEGMTLNPSAANGLEACTPAQARIHSTTFGVACPAKSQIGTVTFNTPNLPAGSLTGNMYLGGPETGSITGPPYTVYLNAESTRYDVDVRIQGSVTPSETTGRLTVTFAENPEQPLGNLILHLNGGPLAPLANPLACGTATTEATFAPFTGTAAQSPLVAPFTVDSNNAKGACPSPLPFAPTQSTQNQTGNGGGHTSFTFNLARGDGQQYLSQVKTVLPAGLVGAIPSVTPCGEQQANEGTCSSTSQIGGASAVAGSGPTPFSFGNGAVYLTGTYNGAPYGLSIVVPAVAGPFNLGPVVTRATLNVDPSTGRITIASVLPRIVRGVPLRLKGFTVAINKQGFLFNPTSCAALATESTLTGFTPGSSAASTVSLSSPFQLANCNALAFKPSFKGKTSARTSKRYGASLETTINQVAGQANIKSVLVQLPKQLPSRLTTLQKACPEATFAANPYTCPGGSFVGGVRANTPVLPGKLKGPAILVSHGGEAFPDLDLVLEADGVKVILVGNTKITKGITTTSFASPPDVPVSSITVNLPVGGHSALAANGNLCANGLLMPITAVGQNGVQVKNNTRITVNDCGVRIVGRRVVGSTAYLTVQTFAAGRISGKGSGLATTFRSLGSAARTATLKVNLSRGGLRRGRPFSVRVRVGFVPKKRGARNSIAYATVRFR